MTVPRQTAGQKPTTVRDLSSVSAAGLYRRWRLHGERQRALDRSMRLALALWLILAVAVGIRTVVRPAAHTVFPIFAASAEHWWGNRSLYDLYPPLDHFRYPPVFAVFVTPFRLFGLTAGGILWTWLNMAVYLAGLLVFVRDVIPSAWTRRRTAVFLALGAFGALRGLWNAQSNALSVGLLLLGTATLIRAASGARQSNLNNKSRPLIESRAWWLAAFLLALAVCLKLTPLPPILLLCALWPRQLPGRLLVVMAAIFLVPFLTRPPDVVAEHYREWFDHLLQSGNGRWLGFRDGWTVWLVLRHWIGGETGPLPLREPMDSAWYRLVQLATAAAALGWCLWQQRRAVRLGLGTRWLAFVTLSMGLAWLMLFGPAVEHATYVFLTAPLAWALLERRTWPGGQGLVLAAFALIMVLGWGAMTRLLSEWPVLLTALPFGTALYALWLIGYAQSRHSTIHPG